MVRRNKYLNNRRQREEGEFGSDKEYLRFLTLKEMEEKGEITDLQRQVKFELIPQQREPDTVGPKGGIHKGKVIEQSIDYIADFVYKQNGELVVEDVKPTFRSKAAERIYKNSGAYARFAMKRKLMLWVHGIRVREI